MDQILLYVIIAVIVLDYLLGQMLGWLNASRRGAQLPGVLQGIYEEEKYKKSQAYDRANHRFSIVTGSFNFILILLFIYFSGFAYIDYLARMYFTNIIVITIAFFGMVLFASDILHLPFELYDTFVIEHKFGFNRTTPKLFVTDKLKSWLLALLIGGALLALVTWFYTRVGNNFWIYAWAAISIFMLLMAMFYTSVIVPLFNKLKPLEDGGLKDEIMAFCKQINFRLDNVYVMDGSKRSSKANAYFSGLGKKKKIVLFDTLIEKLTTEEIVSVLAHEAGHYKKKHTLVSVVSSIIQTGASLYILSIFVGNPDLSKALGAETPSFHLGLITFGFLYSPISLILGLAMNVVSRKNEYSADRYATLNYSGYSLQGALKKLSVTNLSNLTPHPLYVFFNYSHPTLLSRLNHIDRIVKNK